MKLIQLVNQRFELRGSHPIFSDQRYIKTFTLTQITMSEGFTKDTFPIGSLMSPAHFFTHGDSESRRFLVILHKISDQMRGVNTLAFGLRMLELNRSLKSQRPREGARDIKRSL